MKPILYHEDKQTAIVTLNRPEKHNAFNDELINELTNQLSAIEKNDRIRVVILKAEGKNFSAGADVNWMKNTIDYDFQKNKQDASKLAFLLKTLSRLNKPVIALAQGRSMGGALGLLAASDIVIASSDAQFCFSEVKLGIIPATISPYVMRKMGFSETQFYFLTADLFNAVEAKHMHLINRIVPSEELVEAGFTLAKQIEQNGPAAITMCKALLNNIHPIHDELIEKTTDMLAQVRVSHEGQEGLKAFLEKRQPNWK